MIKQSLASSLLLVLILLCCFACTGRAGLEKSQVPEYYSAPADSLKQKAAVFLLKHMPAHYSNESPALEKLEETYAGKKREKGYIEAYEAFSSALNEIWASGVVADFERVDDDTLVSGDYLVENIEQAFRVWNSKGGADSVDFETFCEYILPYRVMDEPLDYDRGYLRKKYSFAMCEVNYYKLMDNVFPHLMGVGLSHKVGVGNCIQQAVSGAMIARSVGIPATVDYVPQWGNYDGKHYMTRLIDGKKKSAFELSSFDHVPAIPKDSLPEWMREIQRHKTIPKVYRMTWSVQPERLLLNSDGRTEGTGLFQDLYEKDVTDEYTDCSTFSMQVGDSVDIAYLCVFSRNGWIPVCAVPANEDSVVFEKTGRGVVYLPAMYKSRWMTGGYMQPIGTPFYFSGDGECIALDGKGGQAVSAKLHSKYPMFAYTATHAYRMKGGKLQGAHKADFSDAKTLYSINYYPFYRQEVEVDSNEAFRYFRYLPPSNMPYGLSELQFYTWDESNRPKQIRGTYFEPYKTGHLKDSILNDNDLDTYVMGSPIKDSWIGYDAGENKEAQLTEIVFAPQNDGNCIVPGYAYELFFWQEGDWQSLGAKQAETNFLEYSNLPQHALFLLRCYTRGVEERVFTLEDGKQVWW